MTIAIPMSRYTGKTSKNPIIIDLVNVVARPTKKNIAKDKPTIVVILFIYSWHSFSDHLATPKNL